MIRLILQFLFYFFCFLSYSQDLIIKKSGEELKVKIIEISEEEVKFRNFDSPEGNIYVMLKSDIFMVKFENGTKEIYQHGMVPNVDTNFKTQENKKIRGEWTPNGTVNDSLDLFAKGEQDAISYYRGYKSASTSSYFSGLCFGPCGVIVPAIASGISTQYSNLGYPNAMLFKNKSYRDGYISRASKMKEKKVWRNYIGGLSTLVAIIGIVTIKVLITK